MGYNFLNAGWFCDGGLLGILLAIGIVHVPTLNKSVLPWIIASQTIPILAVAR
ncbi:MAG: hypothetical protein CM1200mP30_11780 [Pseudomonadota bacterium]|nr:MAG: hypothetical protein CM1200mP30_11780 [Pseudomonadota bacterium]